MSQVGIPRPVFGGQGPQKSGITLPQIQHPLSRMENPGNMDIRGVSRASDRPGSQPNFGRPLANENAYPVRKSLSAMDRESRRSSRLAMSFPQPNHAQAIPEGVEVTYGDPDKTRLPVFGNRAEVASRNDMNSRMSSRLSSYSTKARLEVDELEAKLRQKVMGCFYEVKKKFKDNDPEQKGNVSREALHRILVVLLGQEISQPVFIRLLERLGFGDKGIINYTELFAYFRQMPDDYPSWMDPVQRQWQEKAVMSAAQVHAQLREKAKQRIVDIADLIPQINPGGSNRILKHEFKQMLNKLAFYMEDTEFEKLWKRYDPKNTGTINGEQFMNNLGIFMGRNGSGVPGQRLSPLPEGASPGRSLKRKEVERKQSLDIERWLKTKFREGCANMRESFLAKDAKNSGLVGFDDFLEVLCQYGLHLEKKLLAAFLNRCGVTAKPQGVPYLEFLHRFQDRSEDGMTHNILTNSKHRVNQRPKSPGNISTMSGIEVQIMNMFQRDFLALLGTFKQLDKLGLNVLSQEEFRAAMESRFSLNLTDAQWNTFVDRLPLDEDGNVQYASFMKQFDSKGLAPSLFDKPPNAGSQPQPAPAAPKAPAPAPAVRNAPSPLPAVPEDMEVDLPVMEDDEDGEDFGFRRSVPELFKVIKDLLTRRYQDVERKYNEIDEINTRRLSQDDMYNLLKCFDVHPEISRGEIRDLWSTFILNSDRTLEWLQFVRHFGFSPKSAAFPNAKVNPPRRGDADFMLRSKKLNSAADMLMDSLRSKVDYMWEELRKEFVAMDPYNTRFVSREEFKDVLTELCVHLSDYEVNLLCDKFDISKDGRVSYYEFLKPFALKKQIWRHGNNMLSLLQHPQPELPIPDIVEPPQKGLHGITAKLRQKLAGDWKNLRRAFKKLDKKNDGYLSLPEFRSVLKLANVILDEDEVYHVMTQFDNKMTGKIPYEKFIEETFKPPSRHSVKKLKA